jgi:hypothetical protein
MQVVDMTTPRFIVVFTAVKEKQCCRSDRWSAAGFREMEAQLPVTQLTGGALLEG